MRSSEFAGSETLKKIFRTENEWPPCYLALMNIICREGQGLATDWPVDAVIKLFN